MTIKSESILLSVIIAAKDEGKSIGSVIRTAKRCLRNIPHEIIVVDDGSKDNTAKVVLENGAILISHIKNMGKGRAIRTGALKARGSILAFIDGDGAHNSNDIIKALSMIQDSKSFLINGSRALSASTITTTPFMRRLLNNLASLIISVIVSIAIPLLIKLAHPETICNLRWTKITDCTSGFRIMKKESWSQLNFISQGFEIETEMICEAAINSLTIRELPITCKWDSKLSKLSIIKDGLLTMKLLATKLYGILKT
ncbi:glycosyltransferase family 2 protein [Chloroflexota bacterium]